MEQTIESSEVFIHNEDIPWESAGEGVRRKILGYDGDLMLVRAQFEEGAEGYIHRHPHRQVSYIESGKFEVNIDGEKKVLTCGDSYFIPPNVDHGAIALEAGTLLDVFTPARESFLNGNK